MANLYVSNMANRCRLLWVLKQNEGDATTVSEPLNTECHSPQGVQRISILHARVYTLCLPCPISLAEVYSCVSRSNSDSVVVRNGATRLSISVVFHVLCHGQVNLSRPKPHHGSHRVCDITPFEAGLAIEGHSKSFLKNCRPLIVAALSLLL